MKKIITIEDTKSIDNQLEINRVKYKHEQFITGPEHGPEKGSTGQAVEANELILNGKIVLPYLIAIPDFNGSRKITGNNQNEPHKITNKRCAVDATIDSIVDSPFTETYQSDYKENRRGHRNLVIENDE